jgi:hypothetical protein
MANKVCEVKDKCTNGIDWATIELNEDNFQELMNGCVLLFELNGRKFVIAPTE